MITTIYFEASSQACSAKITTVSRPGLTVKIFAIDMLKALKSSLKHHRKHVLQR